MFLNYSKKKTFVSNMYTETLTASAGLYSRLLSSLYPYTVKEREKDKVEKKKWKGNN